MTATPPDRSAELPSVDLSECENEPIHLLELVQGHGCLLVLSGLPLTVIYASENTDRFLGRTCADLLGTPVAGVLDDLAVMVLEELVSSADPRQRARGTGGTPTGLYTRSPLPGRKSQRLRGTAHRIEHEGAPRLILELEPCPENDEEEAERTFEAEGFAMSGLTEGENLYQLLDQAVHAIAGLTDYDRVMAYMFHPDWSGEVVAESRSPDLTPFLGLRYPASDIPSQARRLYLTNLLRVIADVQDLSVPLARAPEVAHEPPLDLGRTVLRSVSSYHIEYLRNMGVGATLVVSLLVDGALWGLIACHHNGPKTMPWHRREAVGRLCNRVSERISDILSLQRTRQKRRNQRFIDLVRASGQNPADALDVLFFGAPRLPDVIRCDGLAILAPGRAAASGNTPPVRSLETVLKRAAVHAEDGVYCCHDLAASGLFDDVSMPGCSGMMVAVTSRDPFVAVACFRDEVVREVHWGGDPNKPVEVDAASQRVSPRKSFNLWREEVRGQSRPWEEWSIALMRGVADVLAEVVPHEGEALPIVAAIDTLATGFEIRAAAMVEGLDLADNGALLASPTTPGAGHTTRDIAVSANSAFCQRFDVDDTDIAGQPVQDVLTALGLPFAIAELRPGETQEVEWWSGGAGHRTLQVSRRGLFAIASGETEANWVVFTFDDVTNVYRTQRALGVARTQALARSRGRTEFLAHLARELRGPLHAIQGFSDSLHVGDGAPATDRYRDYAGEIRALSGSLLDLLNELLDVARLDSLSGSRATETFDLTSTLGDVCQSLRESGRDRNVNWDWHLPNERIVIQGDQSALRHAMATLITAALRASPPDGSVAVRLTMERGGEPSIAVSDTGLGLAEDDLIALQRPLDASFMQGSGTGEPRRGLGLALVRGLVDLHGGGVSVMTNPGSGTTVHVTLPRHRVMERDNAPKKAASAPKRGGPNSA